MRRHPHFEGRAADFGAVSSRMMGREEEVEHRMGVACGWGLET